MGRNQERNSISTQWYVDNLSPACLIERHAIRSQQDGAANFRECPFTDTARLVSGDGKAPHDAVFAGKHRGIARYFGDNVSLPSDTPEVQ